MFDNKEYYNQESLPDWLTQDRFCELEEKLQDFIVESSRVQSFLQENIKVNDIEKIVYLSKNRIDAINTYIRYIIENDNDRINELTSLMELGESSILTMNLITIMRESYSKNHMKLRPPKPRKIQRTIV